MQISEVLNIGDQVLAGKDVEPFDTKDFGQGKYHGTVSVHEWENSDLQFGAYVGLGSNDSLSYMTIKAVYGPTGNRLVIEAISEEGHKLKIDSAHKLPQEWSSIDSMLKNHGFNLTKEV